jgi:hypothetical protein
VDHLLKKGKTEMRELWGKAFLAALEETGSVSAAAKAAKISRVTVYAHKRDDPDFAKEWDEALDRAADTLEDEARRRAHDGVDEDIYYKGEKVGTVRKYSDVLLMFLLKGIRPQKWRETRATIPPAELNKLIEAEFERRAKEKDTDIRAPVM